MAKSDGRMRAEFRNKLFKWHRQNRRNFAFRKSNNPYEILVSEVLLKKTTGPQVDRVFLEFTEKFPDAGALADASAKKIEKVIGELGLRKRALDLKQLGREILEKHRGETPRTYSELIELHSVGPYTANAVLCFAFGQAEPMVDTNVVRILTRFFGMKSEKSRPRTDKSYWEAYKQIMPRKKCREFHYAVLDFASLVCNARSPKCEICSISSACRWFAVENK